MSAASKASAAICACERCPRCGSEWTTDEAHYLAKAPKERRFRSLPEWPVRLLIWHRCRPCGQEWRHYLTNRGDALQRWMVAVETWAESRTYPRVRG